jgi:N-sulfoglucosamine sulfohydrolase
MSETVNLSRRTFLQSSTGLTLAALAAARPATGAIERAPRPNLLLYVVDDLGMNDAGCYGNAAIKTPGLDRLAAQGTRFANAYATCATCSASRSSILTGMQNHATAQYGHAHDYHHFRTYEDLPTLPVMLGQAGYRTASAGKFHVAPEETYRFQQYIKGGSPEQMAEQCRALFEADGEDPFFLYFCTTEPHRPFVRDGSDEFSPEEVVVPPYLPDLPETRQELAQYYGSVQRTDRGLMRLLDLLEETGRWEDTVVMFISDNGIAFPGAKTTVYEPGVHLPCVVRDPSQEQQGGVSQAFVSWVDVTPTLLDFADAVPEKPRYHGRSFRSVLDQEAPEGWDEIYCSQTFHEVTMYYPMRVVRSGKWKLIWNIASPLSFPFASDLWESTTWQAVRREGLETYGQRKVEEYLHRPAFELYDLEADPWEANNLAADPAQAERLATMQQKLRAFQERTKDPWILKWKHE